MGGKHNDDRELLKKHRCKARELYKSGKYRESLAENQVLHETAIVQQAPKFQVLGLRFIGLCLYRLDDLSESESSLLQALDSIDVIGVIDDTDNTDDPDGTVWLTRQRLLITNHLCATLRRKGEYIRADKLFREGIEETTLPKYLHERCRLMGNYGAMLDELGQRARADNYYARFEELAELLGDPGRLANARGLAARSAELRGDTETAHKKYVDEERLAKLAGVKLRILAASVHAARQLPPKDSVKRLKEILASDSLKISQSRRIDAHLAISAALFRLAKEHEPNALSASWYHARKVLDLAGEPGEGDDSHWERRTNALEQLARICQSMGLHGEAFYYFSHVVNQRHDKSEPLEETQTTRKMAQARLDTLKDLATEMVREAHRVDRDTESRERLEKLQHRVFGESTPSQPQASGERIDAWAWADAQRTKAKEHWKILMANDFELLGEDSQKDLIKSDFSSSARVDDLARSAHLLATVVERELKSRLLNGYSDRVSFANLLQALAHDTNAPKPLREHLQKIDHDLGPLARLHEQITPLRGDPFKLTKIRNAIAHGSEGLDFPNFDRLAFDAIKCFLAVEPIGPEKPTLLCFIARIPRPAPLRS